MNAHIASLQGQVEMLFSNLDELRSTIPSQLYPQSHQDSVHVNSPPHSRSRSASKHPRFQGPTSSAFSLRVAKSSLQTMGITSPGDGDGAITQDETPMTSPRQQHKPLSIHPDKDPIYFVNKEEAIRLCHIYEEEMGVMYPVVDIDQILRHANLLFDFLGAATRSGIVQTSLHGADAISDDKTNMLKMVISLALMAEGSGQSPLGQRLYESVRASVLPLIFGSIDNIRGLRLITLCVSHLTKLQTLISLNTGRLCIIFNMTMNLCPGVSLASLLGSAWSLVCIGTRHMIHCSRIQVKGRRP